MPLFGRQNRTAASADEQAVERYRYMLRTAPPEMIEQAHQEAFARLTPEQRRLALEQLASAAPAEEVRRASDDPASLARLATRTEMRQPGILERLFGSVRTGPGFGAGGAGLGFGGMLAGSLLGSIAGTFIGGAIAGSFFHDHPFESQGLGDSGALESEPDAIEPAIEDGGDFGGDAGGDFGDIEI